MAKQTLTNTPASITLTADTWYTLQNAGSAVMYVQESNSTPADASAAFRVSGGDYMLVKRTGANQIYVWQGRSTGGYGSVIFDTGE